MTGTISQIIPTARITYLKRSIQSFRADSVMYMHHVLHYIQELQYEYYCRQVKLDAGYPPRPKNVVYSELHRQILSHVAEFNRRFHNLQVQFYLYPGMYLNNFIVETRHYLSAVSHLLCQEKKY